MKALLAERGFYFFGEQKLIDRIGSEPASGDYAYKIVNLAKEGRGPFEGSNLYDLHDPRTVDHIRRLDYDNPFTRELRKMLLQGESNLWPKEHEVKVKFSSATPRGRAEVCEQSAFYNNKVRLLVPNTGRAIRLEADTVLEQSGCNQEPNQWIQVNETLKQTLSGGPNVKITAKAEPRQYEELNAPELRVTGLALHDQEARRDVVELKSGTQVSTHSLRKLNIRADTSGLVGSVHFTLSGPMTAVRTDKQAPWYLFDDVGQRGARDFPAGSYTITATPYTESDGTGLPGQRKSVPFDVEAPELRVTGLVLHDHEVGHDVMELKTGAQVPAQSSCKLNIRANTSGSVGSVRLLLSGPVTTEYTENQAPWYLFGDVGRRGARDFPAGSYTITATPYTKPNATGQPGQQKRVSFEVKSAELQITGLVLHDHEAGHDLMELKTGTQVQVQSSRKLNIRANTSGSVGSVHFTLSGPVTAEYTENQAPWYLFGDVGKRGARDFPAGSYSITATPYTGPDPTSTPGQRKCVSFTVRTP